MRILLLACVASLALGMGYTLAADLPTKAQRPAAEPAPSWDGFYVGGSVGMRISDSDWNTTGIRAAPSAPDRVTATGHFGNASVRGGLYAGFNIQRGFWVYGLEGDVGSANNTERHLGIPGATPLGGPAVIYDPSLDSTRIRLGWDASIRARVGMLMMPTVLLYATGGAAFQDIKASATCNPNGTAGFCVATHTETVSTTRTGWTVGAGIEAILGANWTGRLEYRFADFGTFNHTSFAATPADQVIAGIKVNTHTVAVGLAYKFGEVPVIARF